MLDLEELTAAQPAASSGEEAGQLKVAGQFDLNDLAYTGTIQATSWRIAPTPDLPLSAGSLAWTTQAAGSCQDGIRASSCRLQLDGLARHRARRDRRRRRSPG